MSGGFRTGIKKPKVVIPTLPPRPDLTNPAPDIQPPGGAKELPRRIYLHATVRVKKLKPLARVKRKGWVRPGKWPTLWLEISEYINDIPGYTGSQLHRTKKQRQALQVCLHEMMHIALWDDLSINHADDPDSLLHYFVEGDTLEASEWDLEQMKSAAKRIGRIEMDLSGAGGALLLVLLEAIDTWNEWIGRKFFQRID
ncbi:MAG: hypothetical protein ACYTKD_16990 [Planctomycetota bacterium]|jgi:hypothetical protein